MELVLAGLAGDLWDGSVDVVDDAIADGALFDALKHLVCVLLPHLQRLQDGAVLCGDDRLHRQLPSAPLRLGHADAVAALDISRAQRERRRQANHHFHRHFFNLVHGRDLFAHGARLDRHVVVPFALRSNGRNVETDDGRRVVRFRVAVLVFIYLFYFFLDESDENEDEERKAKEEALLNILNRFDQLKSPTFPMPL